MKRINLKRSLSLLLLLCFTAVANAQEGVKQAGGLMRSNGRSYVVIAVMLTILAGLILYLVRLDRKIGKMEKEN